MKQYYAHTKCDENGEVLPMENWQLLHDHLKNTAEIAASFAEEFKSADFAYIAGILHDIGKGRDDFQAYLCRESGISCSAYSPSGNGHSHSAAGAYYSKILLEKKRFPRNIAIILSYIIAGHHAGLPDYSSTDAANIQVRLIEGEKEYNDIKDFNVSSLSMQETLKIGFRCNSGNFHFWIRMLFSCLIDADRLDTERFVSPKNYKLRNNYLSIEELNRKFQEKHSYFLKNSEKTAVNDIRNEIRKYCIEQADSNPGIYSLSVPTGGGKTLAGTEFALRHCIKHGKKRIIYVIPYTSIIEQTARILKSYFGAENVVEHHSNFDFANAPLSVRLATENWDAPVIVTTNVQFFESIFAATPGKCRKLHNIANSVVILDEAQLLPPELLDPCQKAIKELSDNYGVSFLISTATQPVLGKIGNVHEIIPSNANLNNRLKRVDYSIRNTKQEFNEIANEINECKQPVLCIVNRKKDAVELHKLIPESYHLSASMCAEHRSQVIQQVRDSLKSGKNVRLISTQLIEAGVDIDFPVVYRAMAGIDSIKQAAGRCNREGRSANGKVIVFVPPKSSPSGILLKAENAAKEIFHELDSKCAEYMFSPDIDTKYFSRFYTKTDQRYDYDYYFANAVKEGQFQFREGADNFKIIDDRNVPVFVNYGNSPALLEELRLRIKNKYPLADLLRKLQRYVVNVYANMIERECIAEKLAEGIYIWNGTYDNDIGLVSDEISFKDLYF